MHSDGPITLADAAADYFTLAHYICGRHCQFTQMGPLHQQMLLPMASIWPIIFWEALPMHSDGPIALAVCLLICFFGPLCFLWGTAYSVGRAHLMWGAFGGLVDFRRVSFW